MTSYVRVDAENVEELESKVSALKNIFEDRIEDTNIFAYCDKNCGEFLRDYEQTIDVIEFVKIEELNFDDYTAKTSTETDLVISNEGIDVITGHGEEVELDQVDFFHIELAIKDFYEEQLDDFLYNSD